MTRNASFILRCDVNQTHFFCDPLFLHQLNVPDVNKQPVLKASAIKYVMTFRTVLAKVDF